MSYRSRRESADRCTFAARCEGRFGKASPSNLLHKMEAILR